MRMYASPPHNCGSAIVNPGSVRTVSWDGSPIGGSALQRDLGGFSGTLDTPPHAAMKTREHRIRLERSSFSKWEHFIRMTRSTTLPYRIRRTRPVVVT
jgi:hypothetical protein